MIHGSNLLFSVQKEDEARIGETTVPKMSNVVMEIHYRTLRGEKGCLAD